MRLMQNTQTLVVATMALSALGLTTHAAQSTVQLGPRPFYPVDQLEAGELKNNLEACVADIQSYQHHDFSIGHRGRPCSSRSTPRRPTKRAVGWGRASSSAT